MRGFVVKAACAVFLSVSASVSAPAGSICWGPVYDPASNADLYVVSKGTWTQAEATAVQLGGHLLTIHDAAENAFIVNNVLQDFTGTGGPNLSALPAWIGLYDPTGIAQDDGPGGLGSQHAADFVWADGSTSTYRNWNPEGGANDYGGTEYYATIDWMESAFGAYQGEWDDNPLNGTQDWGAADGPYYGIAAVPVPEPSTIALLGIGAVSLLAYACDGEGGRWRWRSRSCRRLSAAARTRRSGTR